jgi:hypothetical protein
MIRRNMYVTCALQIVPLKHNQGMKRQQKTQEYEQWSFKSKADAIPVGS